MRLQFDPLSATVTLNLTDPAHTLNITVYGNVTGQTTKDPLQPYTNKTYWDDPSQTNGRIIDKDNLTNVYSTLFPKLYVLNYRNYATSERFCGALINLRSNAVQGRNYQLRRKTSSAVTRFGLVTAGYHIGLRVS